MKTYRCLSQQEFKEDIYRLIPIRDQDKYDIMKWRNEQMYHLRQNELLTTEKQESYFKNVIEPLFEQEQPSQILFSFLKNDTLIGYGGLVHINWIDQNAEISFLLNTEFVGEELLHNHLFKIYLSLIEEVGFSNLNFHKLYAVVYDIRPEHIQTLRGADYQDEGRLKEHVVIGEKYFDVLYLAKIITLK